MIENDVENGMYERLEEIESPEDNFQAISLNNM